MASLSTCHIPNKLCNCLKFCVSPHRCILPPIESIIIHGVSSELSIISSLSSCSKISLSYNVSFSKSFKSSELILLVSLALILLSDQVLKNSSSLLDQALKSSLSLLDQLSLSDQALKNSLSSLYSSSVRCKEDVEAKIL